MVINKKTLLNGKNKKAQQLETIKFFYTVNPERVSDVLRIHGVEVKDEVDMKAFLTELEEEKIAFNTLKFLNDIKLNSKEIAKAYNRVEFA